MGERIDAIKSWAGEHKVAAGAAVVGTVAAAGSLAYAIKKGQVPDTFEGGAVKKAAVKVGNCYKQLGSAIARRARGAFDAVTGIFKKKGDKVANDAAQTTEQAAGEAAKKGEKAAKDAVQSAGDTVKKKVNNETLALGGPTSSVPEAVPAADGAGAALSSEKPVAQIREKVVKPAKKDVIRLTDSKVTGSDGSVIQLPDNSAQLTNGATANAGAPADATLVQVSNDAAANAQTVTRKVTGGTLTDAGNAGNSGATALNKTNNVAGEGETSVLQVLKKKEDSAVTTAGESLIGKDSSSAVNVQTATGESASLGEPVVKKRGRPRKNPDADGATKTPASKNKTGAKAGDDATPKVKRTRKVKTENPEVPVLSADTAEQPVKRTASGRVSKAKAQNKVTAENAVNAQPAQGVSADSVLKAESGSSSLLNAETIPDASQGMAVQPEGNPFAATSGHSETVLDTLETPAKKK